jgi:hypothetical protein
MSTEDTGDTRTWTGSGWTARVQKNEDDDGWAVTMTRDGDSEPVLTSPWTMGRDKKNPKPLNTSDFTTLLKAARDVLTRAEAHARALRHRSVTIQDAEGMSVRVDLDIVGDEDDMSGVLSAYRWDGEKLAEKRVEPSYKLTAANAAKFIAEEL